MTTLAELRQANLKEQKKIDAFVVAPAEPTVEKAVVPQTVVAEQAHEAEANESEAFLARVRESLSSRTMHPIGSKVTTDMSPALFMRAKRYCVEHGNITLRQVFLDLLTNFLQEEGY